MSELSSAITINGRDRWSEAGAAADSKDSLSIHCEASATYALSLDRGAIESSPGAQCSKMMDGQSAG